MDVIMKRHLKVHFLLLCTLYATNSLNVNVSEEEYHHKTNCSQPKIEGLLLQASFANTIGRTRYGVCPKGSTREEKELISYFKKLKSIGLHEYLVRRQRCKYKKRSPNKEKTTKSNIELLQAEFFEEVAAIKDEGEDLSRYFPYGTEIVFNGCRAKGADDVNNTVSMCQVCNYGIILPSRYYPRLHRHVTCHNNTDYSCFTGSGVCVMNYVDTPLLYDSENVGLERLSRWATREVRLTKSCSCQIIKGDLLETLV